MLYLIGTGLNNELDISLRSLEILKNAEHIFIEFYTSKTNINFENLMNLCNKRITKMYREEIEETNTLIELAKTADVVLLIIGTPLFATTHTAILEQARLADIKTKIIHNSSIMNVMGSFGLYSYNFGMTVSIPFYLDDWKPTSFYLKIHQNYINKMHTLCLLDIRVKEVSKDTIFAAQKVYEDERFMSPNEALTQLLHCEAEMNLGIIAKNKKIIIVSRFGCDDEVAYYKTIEESISTDFGEPLHSIIIPAEMDIVEKENVEDFFK